MCLEAQFVSPPCCLLCSLLPSLSAVLDDALLCCFNPSPLPVRLLYSVIVDFVYTHIFSLTLKIHIIFWLAKTSVEASFLSLVQFYNKLLGEGSTITHNNYSEYIWGVCILVPHQKRSFWSIWFWHSMNSQDWWREHAKVKKNSLLKKEEESGDSNTAAETL